MRKSFLSAALASFLLGLFTLPASAGSIVRLIYDGIPGGTVADLTNSPAFPGAPSRTEILTDFLEGTPNDGDNYGAFIRGYVEAPQTGAYIFWISSDDASELWLSTDHAVANKKRIARVDGVTGYRAWNVTPLQRSASIYLQRGRKYDVEVYHKEGGGGDSVSVGWRLPDGTLDRPISGLYVAPFPAGSNDPPVITQQPVDAMKMEVQTATFFVNVTGTQPINYQWFRNGAAIPGAILSSYTTGPVTLADDGTMFSVGITNAFGDAMSANATLHVTADTIPPAIQFISVMPGAECKLIQVRVAYSEPVDPATATDPDHYQINGSPGSVGLVTFVPGQPNQVLFTPILALECDHIYNLAANGVQDLHGNPAVINMAFDTLGIACCHPTYQVDLLPGLNSIANHLDKGGNTVAEVLAAVPDATLLYKWNVAGQNFIVNSFDLGTGWADPSMTLSPGEGALIQPGPFGGTTFPVTFAGTLRVPAPPPPLNASFQLRSRQTPQAAKFEDLTGALPSNGSLVYKLRPGAASPPSSVFDLNTYTIHTLIGGLWDGGEPIAGVGEAVFIRQAAPVIITTHPANQPGAPPGSTVALSVVATGEPPLHYQWRLNGVNIPGAMSPDLVLTNVQATNSGNYSVGVANSVSGVNSSNALVRVLAPPLQLNDQFESASIINSPNFVGRGNNVGATTQVGEPNHVGRPPRSSVWISWMAPLLPGIVTFTTAGSSFDTRLAAYSGSLLNTLTVVASDDDRAGYHTSRIQFNVAPGSLYAIAVDSLFDEQGDVVLTGTFENTLDVLPVIVNQPESAVANIGGTVTFIADSLGGANQWFLDGVALPGETGNSLTRNNVQFSNIGAYFVRVTLGTRSVDSDVVTLQINTSGDNAVARDKFADVVTDASGFSPPGFAATKSTLAQRIRKANVVRGFTGTQGFSLAGATKDPEEPNHCGVLGGASVLIAYSPTNSGRAVWNTDGSANDTVLAIYTGPGDSYSTLVPVACDNNSGLDHLDSALSFNAMVGTTYWVFVDDVAGNGGQDRWNYRLELPLNLTPMGYTNGVCFCYNVTGTPGLNVKIQGSTNLTSWTTLHTNLLSNVSGAFTHSDTNAPAILQRFYRAVYVP